MPTKEELIRMRDETMSVLNDAQEKIHDYNRQIRDIEREETLKELEKAGIRKGTCFVGIARNFDYHCILVTLIKINEVSKTGHTLKCIGSSYRIDDGDYSYLVSEHIYMKSAFAALSETFEMFSINDKAYAEIQSMLSNLEITFENIETLKENIKEIN